jgi:hypothetical protein
MLVGALILNDRIADDDLGLQRTGATRLGEVTELRPDEDGNFVHVEYRYAGRDRTMEIYVLADDRRQYSVREDVTVVIDRDDPDRVTLRGESNHKGVAPFLTIMGFLGGALYTVVGLGLCMYVLVRRQLLALRGSARWGAEECPVAGATGEQDA